MLRTRTIIKNNTQILRTGKLYLLMHNVLLPTEAFYFIYCEHTHMNYQRRKVQLTGIIAKKILYILFKKAYIFMNLQRVDYANILYNKSTIRIT